MDENVLLLRIRFQFLVQEFSKLALVTAVLGFPGVDLFENEPDIFVGVHRLSLDPGQLLQVVDHLLLVEFVLWVDPLLQRLRVLG